MRLVTAIATFNTSKTVGCTAAALKDAEKSRIEAFAELLRISRKGPQKYLVASVGNLQAAAQVDFVCTRSCGLA